MFNMFFRATNGVNFLGWLTVVIVLGLVRMGEARGLFLRDSILLLLW